MKGYVTFIAGMGLSLLAHILLFRFLGTPPARPLKKPLLRSSVDIVFKSKAHEVPKIEAKTPLLPPQNKTASKPVASKGSASPAPDTSPESPSGLSSYENLLPGRLTEGPRMATGSERQPYTGEKLAKLLEETSDLSADFDLPLVLRRDLTEGKASARLSLNGDGSIDIESLNGKPEIRAALFETLKTEGVLPRLKEIFRYFQAKNVRISIEYRTEHGLPHGSEFETERKIFDKRR